MWLSVHTSSSEKSVVDMVQSHVSGLGVEEGSSLRLIFKTDTATDTYSLILNT